MKSMTTPWPIRSLPLSYKIITAPPMLIATVPTGDRGKRCVTPPWPKLADQTMMPPQPTISPSYCHPHLPVESAYSKEHCLEINKLLSLN